jgi:hypothetical protein
MYQIFSDTPKFPLKRGSLKNLALLSKGGWGDQSVSLMTDNKTLLKQPLT